MKTVKTVEVFVRDLPEIYQVEATTACQMACPYCHREETTKNRGGENHLKVDELKRWIDRGDFGGSYFVELQMSGEPLVHPKLGEIIRLLSEEAKVMVGMSTNGMLLGKKLDQLKGLTAITVSVDTTNQNEYPSRRPLKNGESNLAELFFQIDLLLGHENCPDNVDLQLLFLLGHDEKDIARQEEELRSRFPDKRVKVRSIFDSFALTSERSTLTQIGEQTVREMCVNPWMSVSILSDGTVTSCCYAWDHTKENNYGSLNEKSLKEIWVDKSAAKLRKDICNGTAKGWCTDCYKRSPALMHLDFAGSFVRRS